jgi:hypothetical protein
MAYENLEDFLIRDKEIKKKKLIIWIQMNL